MSPVIVHLHWKHWNNIKVLCQDFIMLLIFADLMLLASSWSSTHNNVHSSLLAVSVSPTLAFGTLESEGGMGEQVWSSRSEEISQMLGCMNSFPFVNLPAHSGNLPAPPPKPNLSPLSLHKRQTASSNLISVATRKGLDACCSVQLQ